MSIPKFKQSARMLALLLKNYEGPIIGFEEITYEDRLFLTTTCATEVLLHTLAIITGADYDAAQEGLKNILMEKRLKEICDEMNVELEKHRDKWDVQ